MSLTTLMSLEIKTKIAHGGEVVEFRELIQTFKIRYTDGLNMYSSQCSPDILTDVLKQIMSEGKRIEEVNSEWM